MDLLKIEFETQLQNRTCVCQNILSSDTHTSIHTHMLMGWIRLIIAVVNMMKILVSCLHMFIDIAV